MPEPSTYRRSAVVDIYTGDYLDRIRHLEQQAQAAKDAYAGESATLDEIPEYLAIAEEHDELVAEAYDKALHVTVTALPRGAWKDLVEAHPPREGNRGDLAVGVNEDTFREALVPMSVDVGQDVLDDLAEIDFGRLYLTAFGLNRSPGEPGKTGLASRMTQPSGETSN